MSKMFIVVREINEYNQEGAYFVAAYAKRPGFKQLKELLGESDEVCGRLTRGGGRKGREEVWWSLVEVEDGADFTALDQEPKL